MGTFLFWRATKTNKCSDFQKKLIDTITTRHGCTSFWAVFYSSRRPSQIGPTADFDDAAIPPPIFSIIPSMKIWLIDAKSLDTAQQSTYHTRSILIRTACIFSTPFFSAIIIKLLQTIHVLNKEIWAQNPWFMIKSGFKSRSGYNGMCTVVYGFQRVLKIVIS